MLQVGHLYPKYIIALVQKNEEQSSMCHEQIYD